MKLRLLLFGLLLSSVAPVWAQDEPVDVTTLLADTKTFIFSNNRSTVKGYIYAEMEAKTLKSLLNGISKMAKPCKSIPQNSIAFFE